MAKILARHVADTILSMQHKTGGAITNLKLQKLLYYAQAWHLAIKGRPLFEEEIEAWVHGPVVPQVFRAFKHCRWTPIEPTPDHAEMASSEFVSEVLDAYGSFGATQLERLTHREEPWRRARAGLPPDVPSHNVITKESIKRYYSAQLRG